MFSAVAMMAFSVSSMGNTIEATSDNLEFQNDLTVVELDEDNLSARVYLNRCEVIFFGTMALAANQGFDAEDAHSIAYAAFVACDEAEQN